jgi:hypothetical protein
MTTTPRGLKAGGRRLWSAVTTDFDLDESAQAVLTQACYTVDLLAELRAKLAETPAVIDSAQGPRVHPLVVEVRQQRLALAKLIQQIGLPKEMAYDGPAS